MTYGASSVLTGTLIRKHQGEGKHWTVVEVSSKFMDRRSPFGVSDQFLLTSGFEADCETLTLRSRTTYIA